VFMYYIFTVIVIDGCICAYLLHCYVVLSTESNQ